MKVPRNKKEFMAWAPRFYPLSWWSVGKANLHRGSDGTHLYGPDKLRNHVYGTITLPLHQMTTARYLPILSRLAGYGLLSSWVYDSALSATIDEIVSATR